MFSEENDLPGGSADSTAAGIAIPAGACPVVWAYAEGLRTFLTPTLMKDFERRSKAIAESKSSADVKAARARHLLQYVVKTCLPEGFGMFMVKDAAEQLRALPNLEEHAGAQEYHDKLAELAARPWDLPRLGPKVFKASMLKPLDNTQRALALLMAGEPDQVGMLLAPALERLGSMDDVLALLDNLLAIGSEDGKPLKPLGRAKAAAGGLTFF